MSAPVALPIFSFAIRLNKMHFYFDRYLFYADLPLKLRVSIELIDIVSEAHKPNL